MGDEGDFLIQLLAGFGRAASPPPRRIDWPYFTALVKKHRLSALLYYYLRQANGENTLPAPVRKPLENEYQLQLARSVLVSGYLQETLSALRKAGIEILILKGAHLAEAYYPHPALRPFDDVDLLIRPARAEPARALLEAKGYQLLEETESARKFFLLKAQRQGGFFLELHTGLQTPHRKNPSFNIRISDFWEESAPFSYRGVPARVLEPTRNLFYLACHLSHHGFARLIWLYDLHLVMTKSEGGINWDALVEAARRSRSAGLVYYPLKFAGELLGSPVPKSVRTALSPPLYKKLAGGAWLKANRLERGFPTAGGRGAALRFLLNDSWPLALKSYILMNDKSQITNFK